MGVAEVVNADIEVDSGRSYGGEVVLTSLVTFRQRPGSLASLGAEVAGQARPRL